MIINGEEKEIPDPDRVGETFQAFIGALTAGIPADHPAIEEICEYLHLKRNSPELKRIINGLGYDVEYQSLIAADFGAPTTRKRFALVGRCDGNPIVWPDPTHAPRDSEAVKSGKCKPWRSAAEIIDWALPSYSIFASKQEIKEKYGVDARRPLADNVYARFMDAMGKIQSVEDDLVAKAREIEKAENQEQNGAAVLRIMAEADRETKKILTEVFGEGNDFDKLLGGVNLLAVASNGERVITNFLAALQPIMLEGVENCAKQQADKAVAEAKLNRAQRRTQ